MSVAASASSVRRSVFECVCSSRESAATGASAEPCRDRSRRRSGVVRRSFATSRESPRKTPSRRARCRRTGSRQPHGAAAAPCWPRTAGSGSRFKMRPYVNIDLPPGTQPLLSPEISSAVIAERRPASARCTSARPPRTTGGPGSFTRLRDVCRFDEDEERAKNAATNDAPRPRWRRHKRFPWLIVAVWR